MIDEIIKQLKPLINGKLILKSILKKIVKLLKW